MANYPTHHQITLCPFCGKANNMQGSLDADISPPSPGDVAICIDCGEVSVFDERRVLRKPTHAESIEHARSPDIERARRAWAAMDRARRKGVV